MQSNRLMQLVDLCAEAVRRMFRHIDAGMTASTAFEICFQEIDAAYRLVCQKADVEPNNRWLRAPDVEMQARFALDALFGAQDGGCDRTDQIKAFWLSLHKATRFVQPLTKAAAKPAD